jgi:diaminopimelate epimerase
MIPAVRFEKWQALGNDYLIVEASALPTPLTPPAVRLLCDPHVGVGADGVLELEPSAAPGFVARLRIHNPDGSEAELSGNGAREAIMYLRRAGWTQSDSFSIETIAGEIRATITGPRSARIAMGTAAVTSSDYPGGPPDGTGDVTAGGRNWRFQHVSIGNPQCAIRVDGIEELETLDLPAIGPEIEHAAQFPNRTNTSFWCDVAANAIRARIFERGVGETRSSGTGACGAAVAHVLGGGESPVTVHLDGGELEVAVGEALHVDLTGWAIPVYRGELSSELLADLVACAG